jgi:GTP cyclohydrolase II
MPNYPFENWLSEARSHLENTGRPLVSLCYAQSLDGSLTDRCGYPLAISGSQASLLTHHLRSLHDGILAGIGTVLADDPQLTVRLVKGRSPRPIILDSTLRLPLSARLLDPQRQAPRPWVATVEPVDPQRQNAIQAFGGRVLVLPAGVQGGIDLQALLNCLGELGLVSLMVEGGIHVIDSFLTSNLANFVVITIAPRFIGGCGLAKASGLVNRSDGNGFPELQEMGFDRVGEDLLIWGRLN